MKCLSLWQPYASLVAIEAKRIETRHWPAPHWIIGQRVAIHATLTKRDLWLTATPPFCERLAEAGITHFHHLPLGAVLCTVVVDSCEEMTREWIGDLMRSDYDEYRFGSYKPGRFAIRLRDVEHFAAPIPFKGRQGKFIDVPDELFGLPPAPRHEQGTLL